jgi:thioredoxin-dependent peroxiredoxin
MKPTRILLALFLFTITSIGHALEVGDQAPDFQLEGTDGKTYKLSDFKGKESVVLAWFPKAYTRGCTIVWIQSKTIRALPRNTMRTSRC